jgi:hypothetical protein
MAALIRWPPDLPATTDRTRTLMPPNLSSPDHRHEHASPPTRGVSRRVDPAQARRIADAFRAAPRHAATPPTRAAYADLEVQSSRWYHRLTGPDARHSIRVVFTNCRQPYSTSAELAASVRENAVLELWPSSRDRDRRHPLLDAAVGGGYDRLRAVHDIVSHAWLGHGFHADGEYSAWLAEDRIYQGPARWALATELHGEHSVQSTTDDLADHKAVLLNRALLRAFRGGRDNERRAPCASS